MNHPIHEHCAARAALAGNPSDGYGGAVTAIPVHSRSATVSIRPADEYCFGRGEAMLRFATWQHLLTAAATATPATEHALLLATAASCDAVTEPFAIEMSTTIPRSVGLAGSSAIVIAALRALHRWIGADPHEPTGLASQALAVEVEQLGITAGLQDRLVQAHDTPLYMNFATSDAARRTPTVEVRTLLPRPGLHLFVATLSAASEPSQVVHGDLRRRAERGDATIAAAMSRLGALASDAATAIEVGDVETLGSAMQQTFELRRTIVPVAPPMTEMVAATRRCGAWANSTGSGGSIVVLAPDAATAARTRQALEERGCAVFETDPTAG